jgi:ABC-type multidrug transport system permease subunit
MNAIWMLLVTNIRLSYRSRLAFFMMVLMPIGFFFVYCGLFAQGNPNYVRVMVQPLITFLAITSALYGVGGTLVALRERDILRRFHLAPLSAFQMVVSTLLATYATFLPVAGLMLMLAGLVYHVTFPLHAVLSLWLILSLGYVAVGGGSMVMAGVVNTAQESNMLMQVIFLILLLFSGSTVPLDHMPSFIQHLSLFFPPTLMLIAGQGIILRHHDLSSHLPELLGLSVVGISAVCLAAAAFRWERGGVLAYNSKRIILASCIPIVAVGLWLNYSSTFRNTNSYLYKVTQPSK